MPVRKSGTGVLRICGARRADLRVSIGRAAYRFLVRATHHGRQYIPRMPLRQAARVLVCKTVPNTHPKPIAATYARVSLPGQTDNFSLPSQRRAMLKLAAEKGYRVPKEFEFVDGGCLGGEMDRPEFCRMRELVRGQQVKAIICYDTDRLVRGLHLQLLVEEECEKFGVALEYVMLPADQSAEGKMLRQMRGVFGEYEKAKFKERSSRGRKEKLQAGFFPSEAEALYEDMCVSEGSRRRRASWK